ncbi:hypothetical protein E4T42_01694 [Aureobasidium subglaciale]|nr:hypothetical protein E4T42_01694 [Aureobasidium subglaciale]
MTSQEPIKVLLKGMADLQESSDHSDLTITCGSDVYKVHKAIVCSQSEFFHLACCYHNDPDGDFKEGKTGVVDIPARSDIDAEDLKCVKLMIHFLYHMDYLEVETAKIEAGTSPSVSKDYAIGEGILIHHAMMYAMGDKYGIPGLKSLARSKFQDTWKHTAAGLVKAIKIAYTSTVDSDKGLRQVIVENLYSNVPNGLSTWMKMPEIDECIKDLPELSYTLLHKELSLPY